MYRSVLVLIVLGLLAGKATAQEREWSLDASEEDAYLIFGVADTDDVGVSLWCPLKKGVVHLFVPRPTSALQPHAAAGRIAMKVTAGPETSTFAAKIDVNPEAPSSSVEAEIPANHTLFGALQRADRFTVRVGAGETVFPLYDADIAGLLDLCRKD